MTETLKTAEPSELAVNAAADYHSQCSGRGSFALPATFNWHECIAYAYAIDVAPLIVERDRLAAENARLVRENAAMLEALDTLVTHGRNYAGFVDATSWAKKAFNHADEVLAALDAPPDDDRLAQAESAIAEAVEIMRPFAESSANYDGYLAEEDCDNAGVLTVASLRAAHAFVEKHGAPTNGGEE